MLTPEYLRTKFEQGLPYDAYVATGTPDQQAKWHAAREGLRLTESQRALVAGFQRRMHILISSGIWCGDCSAQCPMFAAIEQANPGLVQVRFLNRDANMDLAEQVKICGGFRVPTVLLMNEEFDLMAYTGDKSLTRLRAAAARKLGAACPLPGAPIPAEEIAATMQDWLSEVERVQLLCRLSTKLRAKHGD